MEHDPQERPTLGDYLAPIAARRWMIVAIVALATAIVYAYYTRQDEVYRVSTKLYLAQEANPILGTGAGATDDRTIGNLATLLTSQQVATAVDRDISYPGPPTELAEKVTATPSDGSDFITITASGGSAEEAAAIANGFARSFVSVRSEERQSQIDTALEQYRKQLKAIPRTPQTAAERGELASNIRQLEVASRSAPANATQVDPARPPSSPTSPKPVRNAIAAFGLSLLGSIFLAFLLHRLDPRLRRIEDAASIYQRPVLASVARDADVDAVVDGVAALSPRSIESFRELRVNLDLASPDRRFKSILITSAGPGEGKSTVARNLALAMHEAGRRVVLVDADLRNPRLSERLGVRASTGLTDVLAGERQLDEALVAVEVQSRGVESLGRMGAAGAGAGDGVQNGGVGRHLALLASGPQPPNPPAVLESAATHAVLRELRSRYDVVIIDTPPLLAVSDAIPLLARAEAVLLVARSGSTDRRGAQRTSELIARVPDVNLVGLVVNDLSGPEADVYGGGYGYGRYGYGTERSETAVAGRS